MDDHALQILLKAKNETQAAFMSAGLDVKSFGDKTKMAFLKAEGYTKAFTSSVFSMKGAMVGIAGAAGLGLFIDKSLKAADAIGKTSDRIGISTAALQEYRYAADKAGVQTSNLDKGLEKFSKNLGEARQGTGTLVTFLKKYDEQLLSNIRNAKSSDAALQLIFDAMGNTADAADRAALANAAFGRSGIAMTNMVKDGAEGLSNMRKEANDLGNVITEDLIRGAEAANDALSRLSGTIKTQAMSAFLELAPAIQQAADQTTFWFKTHKDFMGSLKTSVSWIGDATTFVLDYADAWVKTWQALGLASAGQISLNDAIFHGIEAVDRFNQKSKTYKIGASTPILFDGQNISNFTAGIDSSLYSGELSKYQTSIKSTNEQVARDNAKLWQYQVNAAVKADKEMMDAYGAYGDYQKKVNKDTAKQSNDLTDSQARIQKIKLRNQTLEYGNFFDGIKVGIQDTKDGFYTWGEAGLDTFQLLRGASKNTLFSFFTGEIENIGDVWDRTWRGALGVFTNIVDQMVMKWAVSGIGNAFGLNLSTGSGGSGGSNLFTGGGLLGKLGGIFGGTTGASGMTMAASTAHEAALGGGLASTQSSFLSSIGGLPGLGILAGAGFVFSKALGSSGPDAPGALEWIDAWLKGSKTVSGGAADIPQRGGVGWQNLIDKDAIWGWVTGSSAPGQYQYSSGKIKDIVDLIYSDYGKYNDFLSALNYSPISGEMFPWANAVRKSATGIDLFGARAWAETMSAHAAGGDITRVLKIPGLPAPYPDEGWVPAQVGERMLSRSESARQQSGSVKVVIENRIFLDGREIGHSIADQTRKNVDLVEAIRRVITTM